MRTGSIAARSTGFSASPTFQTRASAKDGMKRATGSVELQRALLVEHHGRDRRDRLRHRVDAPDRVVRHRQPGVEVAHPPGGTGMRRAPDG